jgi:hypothetical protein
MISGLAEREKTDHERLIEISWEAMMRTIDKQGVVMMQVVLVSSLHRLTHWRNR